MTPRQRLRKALESWQPISPTEDEVNAAAEALLEATRLIPVTEQMPEEGVPVLALYVNANGKNDHGIAERYGDKLTDYNDRIEGSDATHWQRLSEPD